MTAETRPTIAVDVDDVIFPYMSNFIQYYNRLHSTALTLDDFWSYYFEEVLDISTEEITPVLDGFFTSESATIVPIAEAREAIGLLACNFNIAVITSRHPRLEAMTTAWVGEHFREIEQVIAIGNPETDAVERSRTKADVCRELGTAALIDDQKKHIFTCAEQGIEGILFGSYPWNQAEVLPNGVVRCKNWPEVVEHFRHAGRF